MTGSATIPGLARQANRPDPDAVSGTGGRRPRTDHQGSARACEPVAPRFAYSITPR